VVIGTRGGNGGQGGLEDRRLETAGKTSKWMKTRGGGKKRSCCDARAKGKGDRFTRISIDTPGLVRKDVRKERARRKRPMVREIGGR